MSTVSNIRANLLMCDAAQVVGGKLYILGGGWSYLFKPSDAPVGFVVAIDMIVPWELANRQLKAVIRIVTEDFEEVVPEGLDQPVQAEGNLVVGRPPNARAGADQHVPIVIPFGPVPLPSGGYVCELLVDGERVTTTAFQLADLPAGQLGGV